MKLRTSAGISLDIYYRTKPGLNWLNKPVKEAKNNGLFQIIDY